MHFTCGKNRTRQTIKVLIIKCLHFTEFTTIWRLSPSWPSLASEEKKCKHPIKYIDGYYPEVMD